MGYARPAAYAQAPSRLDTDGVFAFALFATMLFIIQLGTLGAAMLVGLIGAYLLVRRDRFFEIFTPRAFLLLVPAFALFTVLWSDAPQATLKYGIEFTLTAVAGLLLTAAHNRRAVVQGIFIAFAIYTGAALLYGQSVFMGRGTLQAFSGLTQSKNLLADITSTGALVSLGLLLIPQAGLNRMAWKLAASAGLLLHLYVLYEAKSAGAMLGLAVGVGAMLTMFALRPIPPMVRGVLTVLMGTVVATIAIFYRQISAFLIEYATRVFDKDPTLTGRTYLWHRAGDLIAEQPLLGRGYNAFWLQGNVEAEGLWNYAGIGERGGFNFHNTAVEILVHMGWVGLIVIGLVAVAGLIALVARFVREPSPALCFWFGLLAYEIARMPMESIGFTPFYFSTALIYAAFGVAFAPKEQLTAWQVPVPRGRWAGHFQYVRALPTR